MVGTNGFNSAFLASSWGCVGPMLAHVGPMLGQRGGGSLLGSNLNGKEPFVFDGGRATWGRGAPVGPQMGYLGHRSWHRLFLLGNAWKMNGFEAKIYLTPNGRMVPLRVNYFGPRVQGEIHFRHL